MATERFVFLDCEFTCLVEPQGLSVGLVADDGRELYVEVDLLTPEGKGLRTRSSTFVAEHVLPQFTRRTADVTSPGEVGDRLADWLLALEVTQLNVAYDYHADWTLVEAWLQTSPRWQAVQPMLVPAHVGYLIGQPDADAASAESWAHSDATDGLKRHHALADARALRAAFRAVHGE